MNRFLFLISLCFLFSGIAYGQDKGSDHHYDGADINNRSYGVNFKDFALLNCLQVADKKLNRPDNKDLKDATGAFMPEWIIFDADDIDKTKTTMSEISRLSEKYISKVGGLKQDASATLYTLGCLNFYHSDDLDNLMRSFVLYHEKTSREEYATYR